ncbi:TPA: PASTA domain-containing protein [bacterium]|jgi:beta-lactam-binding protein with PASTA domain|nr:PASTA domain-containing protein [bacterium]
MRDLSERFIVLEGSDVDKIRAYDKLLTKFVILRRLKTTLGLGKLIPLLEKITNLKDNFLKVLGYQILENGTVYSIEEIPPQGEVEPASNIKELLNITRYVGRSLESINELGIRVKLPPKEELYKDEGGNYFVSPLSLIDLNNPDKPQEKGEVLNLLASFFLLYAPQNLKTTVSSLIERNIICKLDNADAFVNMLNTLLIQEERMKIKTEDKKNVSEAKKEKRRVNPWVIIVIVLLLVAGISVGVLYSVGKKLFFSEETAPDVIVPDIVNKSLPEAFNVLKANNLNIEISGLDYSSVIPAGNVISQDPISGTKVKSGRSINVIISKGIEFVNVPNIIGQELGNARKMLESVGLKIGDIKETYSRTSPDGIVISQNPKYGSITPKNSLVTVEIARHLPNTMPNLIGKTQEEAEGLIDSLGSYKLIIKEAESDTPGVVISQNPLPNTSIIQEVPRIEITIGIPKRVVPQVVPSSPAETGTQEETLPAQDTLPQE